MGSVAQKKALLAATQVKTEGSADGRMRNLIGDEAWFSLPQSVQQRFSLCAPAGIPKVYAGEVMETTLSWAGWAFAQALRILGAPLPLQHGATGPTAVSVADDARIGGQIWTRVYARAGRFPQTVHSAKRFCGPTGLEEYVGAGLAMELAVTAERGCLVFRSNRYVLLAGRWRIAIPLVLTPGHMEIVHKPLTDRHFRFELTLRHPWFGPMVHQIAEYQDVAHPTEPLEPNSGPKNPYR